MYERHQYAQQIVDEIDMCIKRKSSKALSPECLFNKPGCSGFYISRKFKKISEMQSQDDLRYRRPAFALKEVCDTGQDLLGIALNYGFSPNKAFTRVFKEVYSITPSEYRQSARCSSRHPPPLRLLLNGAQGGQYGNDQGSGKDLFCDNPRPGLRNHLRSAGQHPGQAG